MRIACSISEATNTHYGRVFVALDIEHAMQLLLFYGNNVCMNAPQCCVIHTLSPLECVTYFKVRLALKWTASTVKLINTILGKLHPQYTRTP